MEPIQLRQVRMETLGLVVVTQCSQSQVIKLHTAIICGSRLLTLEGQVTVLQQVQMESIGPVAATLFFLLPENLLCMQIIYGLPAVLAETLSPQVRMELLGPVSADLFLPVMDSVSFTTTVYGLLSVKVAIRLRQVRTELLGQVEALLFLLQMVVALLIIMDYGSPAVMVETH